MTFPAIMIVFFKGYIGSLLLNHALTLPLTLSLPRVAFLKL